MRVSLRSCAAARPRDPPASVPLSFVRRAHTAAVYSRSPNSTSLSFAVCRVATRDVESEGGGLKISSHFALWALSWIRRSEGGHSFKQKTEAGRGFPSRSSLPQPCSLYDVHVPCILSAPVRKSCDARHLCMLELFNINFGPNSCAIVG